MRAYFRSVIIILVFVAGCQKARVYTSWDDEELTVVHALIEEINGEALAKGMIVDFECATFQGPKITEPIRKDQIFGDIGNPKGLVEDYAQANAQPLEIPDSIVVELKCRKIRKEELQELFDQKNKGWEEFYRRKPKSLGIHSISRVGFSKDRSMALVYYDYQWESLAGQGIYYVLVKKDKKWVIAPIQIGPIRIS